MVPPCLQALPELKCLYLRGNPFVSDMPNYRKRIIAALPTLTYMDDRPIFEMERYGAEGWFASRLCCFRYAL